MERRSRHISALSIVVALAAAAVATCDPWGLPGTAKAQQAETGASGANFMNPFPDSDVWKGLLIGDYLAEGLAGGLGEAMAGEKRLNLQRRPHPLATLGRADIEADAKALEDLVAREKIHIAVLMLGMQDRQGIRLPNGRRLAVGQGDWRQQYAARVDRVVRALRRRGVAVYWVGLPITRRPDWNEDIEQINEVIRERTLGAGGRYVDAYKESADENGQFSDRGPDLQGKLVRLRDPEGYDFTPAGYRKLAFFIERQMKRDMNAAKEERVVPLAGSEAEQKRINPGGQPDPTTLAAAALKGSPGAKDARAASSPVARALGTTAPGGGGSEASGADLKADNVRVTFRAPGAGGREEQVTVEIVRPALSQSVIQLMTRRDKGDRPSQVGETLIDTLSNGLLVMRSVTPSGGPERTNQRAALTQQPFFIALSKGERLPPKPGRADDFRWPREDDIPPPPLASVSAPISSPVPLGAQPATGRGQQRPVPRPRPNQRPEAERGPPPSSVFQQ
jgi:hypothetical protein